MSLQDIQIQPGVYTDDTARGVGKKGYWKLCDKVRFFDGLPTKLGGWTRGVDDPSFLGAARGTVDWRSTRSEIFLSFGTELKLYVWSGGLFYDITPLQASGTLTNPFSTTNTLATVDVADVAHDLLAGDYVHFANATAVGGITIAGTYTVTSVTNSNQYVITHTAVATSTAGPGGGTVDFEYEIHVGTSDSIAGLGWGAGEWGDGTWGTPRSATDFLAMARIWSIDTWGEDIICSPRQGGVYVWDSSAGTSFRAAVIAAAPLTTKSIFVSPEDRHLVALGAHDGANADPLLIRWCDQENYTDWTPTVTNTAGSKRLDVGNEILCGVKVRGEHLIFTDSALFSMVFVGPPDTFAFRSLGDNGGLLGPMAASVFEGVAYWMGSQDFFIYDGVMKPLDCPITTTVFDDLNRTQRAKIFCGINRGYREVWWLYPSADSDECDSYVIYNMKDKLWAYGTLARTMLVGDSDVLNYAYGFGTDGHIYTHELGADDYLTAMTAYIESGDFEISAGGNEFAHISKLIPDFKTLEGTVDITIKGRKYPQDSEQQTSGPHAVTATTKFINPRVRCRQIAVRLESDAIGDDWRAGALRVDLIPHGGR